MSDTVLRNRTPKRWPQWVNAYERDGRVFYGYAHDTTAGAERAARTAFTKPIYRIRVKRK